MCSTAESIDRILSETTLTLTELAHQQRVKVSTPSRWASIGIKGVKLETIRVGGRRLTSAEAFRRFVAACNDAPVVDPDTRRKSIQRAERILQKAGI